MGRVEGKVAFITGAARGQGRAHAVRLAEEGADLVLLDLCAPVEGVAYPGATYDDLVRTARLVESLGRSAIALKGDVRSQRDLDEAVAKGVEAFGHIDVLVGNAGISTAAPAWEITEEAWRHMIDINLTGNWRAAKAVIPAMIEAGRGGSIIFTTSGLVARAVGNMAHYASSKHGLTGLCRELALELAPHGVRVNTVQPTAVNTPMMDNGVMWGLFAPGNEHATDDERRARMLEILTQTNIQDVPWVEPEDVAAGVLFLASDEARRVTGTALVVDAGYAAL